MTPEQRTAMANLLDVLAGRCSDEDGKTAIAAARDLLATLNDPRLSPMYHDAYMAISRLMDKALGPNEEDGAGQGLQEDVALVVAQRDEARAALAAVEQDRDRWRDRCDGQAWQDIEADRDRLSEELTVVRRERAWLLSNLSEAELEEFRLLAQTAERAREDRSTAAEARRP